MAFNLTGGFLRRLIGVGIAIAIGLGWWGFSTFKAKSDAPDVGQCVTVSGPTTDVDVDEADCGDDGVVYKVTADDGDCDVIEDTYTVTVQGSDAVELCLFWEVEPGDCVKTEPNSVKVECEETKGDPNVVKIVSVGDDASAKCKSKKEVALANVKRDILICVNLNA